MNKLSPENLFVPSQKNVRAILAHYNLPLTRFLHATHGIENLTLFVWSRRKKYVLRVYPQKKKSDADILLELDFMAHLRNNGLPTPAIISSSDNEPLVVCELDNNQWQCFFLSAGPGCAKLRLNRFRSDGFCIPSTSCCAFCRSELAVSYRTRRYNMQVRRKK